jgi:hypothetical protein
MITLPTDVRTLEFTAPGYGEVVENRDWYGVTPYTIVIKPRLQAFVTSITLKRQIIEKNTVTLSESVILPHLPRKEVSTITLRSNLIQIINQTTTTLAPTTTTTTPRPTTTTTTTTQAPTPGFTVSDISNNTLRSNIPVKPSNTLTCEVYLNNNLLNSSLYTFLDNFNIQFNVGFVGLVRLRLVATANITHTDIAYKPPGTYWSNNASMNGATTTTLAPTTTTTTARPTTNPPTVADFTIEAWYTPPRSVPKRTAFVTIFVPSPTRGQHIWVNLGYKADSDLPWLIPKPKCAFYDAQTNLPIADLILPNSIPGGSSYLMPNEALSRPFNFIVPVTNTSFAQSLPRSIYIGFGSGNARSNTVTIQ